MRDLMIPERTHSFDKRRDTSYALNKLLLLFLSLGPLSKFPDYPLLAVDANNNHITLKCQSS